MRRLTIALILCLILPSLSYGDPVTASVDRTVTTSNEAINLTVTLTGEAGDVDVSGIRDFRVISRGTSSSVQIINGNISRQALYNYALLPLKKGRLTIPALPVEQDGKTYYTREIRITVSDAPTQQQAERELFIESSVSETEPYVGQQIVYTFRLYRAVQMANANLQKPDFEGFTAEELEDRKTYRKIVNGREYVVTEVTDILVPLSPGKFEIGPAILKCDLVRKSARRRRSPLDSFFNDSFFGQNRLEPKIYRSDPLSITVKKLPADTGMPPFSGVVGAITLESAIENADLRVGDSTTLTVKIAGVGNLMDAEFPELEIPAAFKLYTDAPEDDIQVDARGYAGSRTMRYALVPVRAGSFEIPVIRLKYFDPQRNAYQTAETKPIQIRVDAATEKDTLQAFRPEKSQSETGYTQQQKVEFVGRDILPLKETLDTLENQAGISALEFALLLLAPGAGYLLLLLVLRMVQKSETASKAMARRSRNFLKAASKGATEGDDFVSDLYKALIFAVFAKAGTTGESLTYAEAKELLVGCGCEKEEIQGVETLLRKIEAVRFGGVAGDPAYRKEILAETGKIVRRFIR
jgi:hypothetical protein